MKSISKAWSIFTARRLGGGLLGHPGSATVTGSVVVDISTSVELFLSSMNLRGETKDKERHSSFPVIHKVGNVVNFVLLRSEG